MSKSRFLVFFGLLILGLGVFAVFLMKSNTNESVRVLDRELATGNRPGSDHENSRPGMVLPSADRMMNPQKPGNVANPSSVDSLRWNKLGLSGKLVDLTGQVSPSSPVDQRLLLVRAVTICMTVDSWDESSLSSSADFKRELFRGWQSSEAAIQFASEARIRVKLWCEGLNQSEFRRKFEPIRLGYALNETAARTLAVQISQAGSSADMTAQKKQAATLILSAPVQNAAFLDHALQYLPISKLAGDSTLNQFEVDLVRSYVYRALTEDHDSNSLRNAYVCISSFVCGDLRHYQNPRYEIVENLGIRILSMIATQQWQALGL
jgi:hypothetical protein